MYLITALLPIPILLFPSFAIFKTLSILKQNIYINLFEENRTYLMSLNKTLNKLSLFVYKMRQLNFAISLLSLQILMFNDSETLK